MRARHLLLPTVVLAMGVAGACSEIGTDPSSPVSIRFDTLPSQAVVEGDTLRDSLGVAAPLTATAFNAAGDTIRNATFTFIARDTTNALTVDPAGRFVVARNSSERSADVTLQTSLGSLQFTRLLSIVSRPDSLAGPTTAIAPALIQAPDTAALRRKNLSSSFTARVLHDSTPTFTPVRSWRVNFEVGAIPDTLIDSVRLVDANGQFRSSAITGTDGGATLQLRIYPRSGLPNRLERDSVIVFARALRTQKDTLNGSPVKIVVPFALCTGPTTGCQAASVARAP